MDFDIPDRVKEFMEKVDKAGFGVYLVGGSVRDLILNRPRNDWDFATNALPEEILQIFPEGFYNNAFGTVGVHFTDPDEIFQITTYRKEGKYSDHRHPDEVTWAETIGEDLARRELTINAMAYPKRGGLASSQDHLFIDPYGGQQDIKARIIRAVGNPEDRFNEDALRMLRAIRFATQLGFLIEENTFSAIKQNAVLLQKISGERIRDEIEKIFSSEYPADGLRLLLNSGLLQYILPELVKGIGVTQKGTHHLDDVFTHSLKALQFCQNKNWVVRLATLLHDVGKPVTYKDRNGKATFYNHEMAGASIARDVAGRLHFKKEDREKLYMLVRWHMFTVSEFISDAAVRRFIRRVGVENTTDMLDLRTADRMGSGVKPTSWRHEEFKKRIIKVQEHIPSVNDLAIDGTDIMKTLGLGPGPQIGKILNELFEEIMEDTSKNNREYLINQIKQNTNIQLQ